LNKQKIKFASNFKQIYVTSLLNSQSSFKVHPPTGKIKHNLKTKVQSSKIFGENKVRQYNCEKH
jgi:hypothetical protein